MAKKQTTTDAVDLKDTAREEVSVPVKDSTGLEVDDGEDLGRGKVQAKMDVTNNQGYFTGDEGVASVDTSHTVAAVTGNLENGAVEEPAAEDAEAVAEDAEAVAEGAEAVAEGAEEGKE